MNKPISTMAHGVIDYVAAITLIVLPRLLNWSGPITTVLTIMGVTTLLYSLVTRYELSVAKLLPMKGHLALDALSGLALLALPFILPRNGNGELIGLIALGLFELGAAFLTRDRSPLELASGRGVYDANTEGDRSVGVYDKPSR